MSWGNTAHPVPPPSRATHTVASASRHRRSLGQTVGEVVEQQIWKGSSNNANTIDNNSKLGSYQPSFGVGGMSAKHANLAASTRDLEDVNEALEARVRNGNGLGIRHGKNGLAGDLGSKPKMGGTAMQGGAGGGGSGGPHRNSLIAIGSVGQLAQTAPPPPNLSRMRQQPARATTTTTTLALSSGPILSSLDDQARRRAAANNHRMMRGGATGGFLGASNSNLGNSLRGMPRRSSLGLSGRGGGVQDAGGMSFKSGGVRGGNADWNPGDSASSDTWPTNGDNYYQFPPPGKGPVEFGRRRSSVPSTKVINEPNTLTLDNWFGSGSNGRLDEESDLNSSSPRGGGSNNSALSSRRNSGLAPLPDVDVDVDDGDHIAYQRMIGRPVAQTQTSTTDQLKDLDEADQFSSGFGSPEKTRNFNLASSSNISGGRPFSIELATSLRVLLFGGVSRGFTPGWLGQSFSFSHSVPFGLEQHRGGPCGVLAAVQAHLIRALCFGCSPLDDTTRAADPLSPSPSERSRALAAAVTEILVRCCSSGGGRDDDAANITFVVPSAKTHFTGVGRYRSDGVTETLVMHEFNTVKQALEFARVT